jgi:hypothetical protein
MKNHTQLFQYVKWEIGNSGTLVKGLQNPPKFESKDIIQFPRKRFEHLSSSWSQFLLDSCQNQMK